MPERLLLAYSMGIFPWQGEPLHWHSPDPRMVLLTDELHVTRSLRRAQKKRPYRLALDTAFTAGGERPAWTIERARPDAIVAINAGQFPRTLPWGWVMLDGREMLAPGRGPLSVGVAIDSAGAVHWIPGDSLDDRIDLVKGERGVVAAVARQGAGSESDHGGGLQARPERLEQLPDGCAAMKVARRLA